MHMQQLEVQVMLRRIFSYMKEYRKFAWLGLLCIAIEVILEIMVPMLMADLIDYGVTNADQSYSFSNIDHFNSG